MSDIPRFDVLTQGSPFCDLTFTFTQRESLPELGQEVFADDFASNAGGSFNISSALSRLGLKVGLKAYLGNDIFSRFTAERMEECGLSFDLVAWVDQPLPLVTVGISFPHDRLFISYSSPNRQALPRRLIDVEDLDRYQPRAIFTYGELGVEVYREAKRRGILTVVDAAWSPEHLRAPALREALAEVSVFVPNLAEAREMTGAETAEEALEELSKWAPCVVIKCGSRGCVACCHGESYEVPAIPVKAVETTGAGDNFNAGLIYGLLHGYPFAQCLRCANIAGGLSTLVLGGCGSGVTADDIENWL